MSMKKLIIALLMMAAMPACAQRIDKPGEPYEYFIQIEPIGEMSGKFKAKIDMLDGKGRKYVVDENGKKLEFVNKADIINYMTKRGWYYVDYYIASKTFELYFKKEIKSDNEAKANIRIEE